VPTAREVVQNRPLAASELRRLIAADFERLLDGLGILNTFVAFGRVGFDLRIAIHTDNAMSPEHTIEVHSLRRAKQEVEADPALAAVETPPLADASADAVVFAAERSRRISSPNAERLRAGLPVTVFARAEDGSRVDHEVSYPADSAAGDGDVTDKPGDVAAAEARARWGLPPLGAAPVATSAVAPAPAVEVVESVTPADAAAADRAAGV